MSFEFAVSDTIPASPQAIYDAWLDSHGHAAMTGGHEATASTRKGAMFTAWDGYIEGRNIELDPGKRIVQSWRTTKFTKKDADSQIEVLLEPVAHGTKVTLRHTKVPDGHTSYRDGGWQDNYFEPMKRYFKAKG
ncbi:MAG: SRPBCC domain-containing protein [Hyphomicrobiales bacterium]